MVANILDAVSAYSKTKALPLETQPIAGSSAAGTGGFAEVFSEFMGDTVQQLNRAENLSHQGVLGKANPIEITTAMASAETSLQMLTLIREKVVSAYQEIARMSV